MEGSEGRSLRYYFEEKRSERLKGEDVFYLSHGRGGSKYSIRRTPLGQTTFTNHPKREAGGETRPLPSEYRRPRKAKAELREGRGQSTRELEKESNAETRRPKASRVNLSNARLGLRNKELIHKI